MYVDTYRGVLVSWAYGFEESDGLVDEVITVERELPSGLVEKVREVRS